ncbi:MAG: iron-only hydrogenase system regulator [Bacteroidales bacterium]|nr:iron-only hydrogenase system regulator [Bacteroidales bacterium]
MEKRIGTITVLIRDREAAQSVNQLLSEHADIILCRQGLPFHDRPVAVISLIVDGTVNKINALTGQLGRLDGVECKAVVTRNN